MIPKCIIKLGTDAGPYVIGEYAGIGGMFWQSVGSVPMAMSTQRHEIPKLVRAVRVLRDDMMGFELGRIGRTAAFLTLIAVSFLHVICEGHYSSPSSSIDR